MKNYQPQVTKKHYTSQYDSLERFVSYYNQKEIVLRTLNQNSRKNNKILEIGKGTGLLYNYLRSHGLTVKTFDIAEDLEPDYVGSITDSACLPNEQFDLVCCFEILEHISFDDVDYALDNIARTSHVAVISVPQIRLYLSVCFKLPLIRGLYLHPNIPFPKKHKFDGEHYWELGMKGYSRKNFRKKIKKQFIIQDEFTHPLDPYHRFFVLRRKVILRNNGDRE